jgi:hypothetical protein
MQVTKHPSGRPIRQVLRGIISQPRCPYDGPLSPGLRRNEFAQAIGFTASLSSEDEGHFMKVNDER